MAGGEDFRIILGINLFSMMVSQVGGKLCVVIGFWEGVYIIIIENTQLSLDICVYYLSLFFNSVYMVFNNCQYSDNQFLFE